MHFLVILAICMSVIHDIRAQPTTVSSGGQLYTALTTTSVTDIVIDAPIISDPYVWCNNSYTITNRRVTIASDSPNIPWELYDCTADRLVHANLSHPCLIVGLNASLSIGPGLKFFSDLTLSERSDVQAYFALFGTRAGGSLSLGSVTVAAAPTSDVAALQLSLAQAGAKSQTDNVTISITDFTTPDSNTTARNVYIHLYSSTEVTDATDWQKALRTPTANFLTVTEHLSLDNWDGVSVINWPVYISTPKKSLIIDTAERQGIIRTVRGGLIRFSGDFAFINCIVLEDRFYEEGLLQFISLSTGAGITDPAQQGGVASVEGSKVYGKHQSLLWSPALTSLYPKCAQDLVIKYQIEGSKLVRVKELYINAKNYFACTANTTSRSESYRLGHDMSLVYGDRPPTPRQYVTLTVVLAVLLPLCCLFVVAAVAFWWFRRVRMKSRSRLGMGPMMRSIAKNVLGDVVLKDMIGWGSYGRVYRATYEGREVAIKVGHPVRVSEDNDPLHEAKLMETLHHINIVQTFKYTYRDVLEKEKTLEEVGFIEPWFVMEYCDKGTLQHALQSSMFYHSGRIKLGWAMQTAKDVASAMVYLHGMGIMHGDLTCKNIMLVTDNTDPRGFHVKVVDFGQAQVFSRWVKQTKDVQNYGTMSHQPPEVLMHGMLTPSADVWAYGLVLYELFTGQVPFKEYTEVQLVYIITTIQHTPHIPSHCPIDLADLMRDCWAKHDKRPSFPDIMQRVQEMSRKYT